MGSIHKRDDNNHDTGDDDDDGEIQAVRSDFCLHIERKHGGGAEGL